MKPNKSPSKEELNLQERAEHILAQYTSNHKLSSADVYKLVHELSVHQIELEMQNDELRQAQAELEKSRNQYVDLYDYAPISYFTFDTSYFIQAANFAGSELLGIERHRLLRKNFVNFVCMLSQPVFYRHIYALLETKTKQVCELELIKKEGQRCYVQMELCLSPQQFIRVTVADITARRLTEIKLIEITKSLYLVKNLFQSATEAIAALDLEYKFITFNSTFLLLFEKLYGCRVFEGMNLINIFIDNTELQAQIIACCQLAVKGEESVMNYELKKSQHNEKYFEIKFNPIIDEHSQIIGLSYLIRDITLFKFKEHKIAKQRAEIAHIARMNTMGEMATALAHEINQPLTAITAYSAGCLAKLEKNIAEFNQLTGIWQQVLSQAEYAGQVIHRMKSFMREGKRFNEKININDIIVNTLGLFEYEFKELQLELRFELASELPELSADRIQIVQVLSNLVTNSIEAIKGAGITKPIITVRTNLEDNNKIVVDIIDNGPGISANLAGKLLNSYFTTKTQGTGLGLAICRTLIEAHGGQLNVKSDYGQGAWLQFILPIIPGEIHARS